MANEPAYDIVIIGAGHNGLTCAAYLARKGYRVKVVERRGVVGGAAVTEEFHPGFRNSVCSYVVSLLDPKIMLTHYSAERLFSPEARAEFVEPDIDPIPRTRP